MNKTQKIQREISRYFSLITAITENKETQILKKQIRDIEKKAIEFENQLNSLKITSSKLENTLTKGTSELLYFELSLLYEKIKKQIKIAQIKVENNKPYSKKTFKEYFSVKEYRYFKNKARCKISFALNTTIHRLYKLGLKDKEVFQVLREKKYKYLFQDRLAASNTPENVRTRYDRFKKRVFS